jgi:NAD(P)H dehydrogenase (quinone)
MSKMTSNSNMANLVKRDARSSNLWRHCAVSGNRQVRVANANYLWLGLLSALMILPSRAEPDQPQSRPPEPSRVLVVYYSLSGNTEQMAAGVVEGAKRVGGVAVELKKVDDVAKADLERADAIILGCPTYYGNIPGKMKVALDDWSWKMKVDFTDKIGGAFSTGGGQVGGKEFVVMSLLVFMLQNRMVVAGPLYQNDKTGSVWGELGASAMTGPLDPGVGQGELDSAQRLGERVARLARKVKGNREPVKSP